MQSLAVDLVAAGCLILLIGWLWLAGGAVERRRGGAARLAAGMWVLFGLGWLVLATGALGLSLPSSPLAVAALVVVPPVIGVRRGGLPAPSPDRLPLAAAAISGCVVSAAVILAPRAPPFGDMALHDGWMRQLAGGTPAPGGPYAGVPNAYPWLYHAIGSLLDAATPGGLSVTVWLLQGCVVIALAAGSWQLARLSGFGTQAATWAVVLTLLGGGRAVTDAPEPVASLAAVPPPLPRDLGLAALALQLAVPAAALRSGSGPLAAAAGASAGLVFLLSPIHGLTAGLVTGLVLLRTGRRLALACGSFAAAVLPWVVPLGRDYHALGGFRTITAAELGEPSLARLGLALGALVVLGAAGLVLAWRTRRTDARVLFTLAAVSTGLVALTAVGGSRLGALHAPAFDKPVRYAPQLGLALAVAGGLAAARLCRRNPAWAVALLLVAAALPAVSSARTAAADRDRRPVDGGCLEQAGLGPGEVAAVLGAPVSGTTIFGLTGAAPLYMDRPRIRFRAIYRRIPSQALRRRWLSAMAAGRRWPQPVTEALVSRPSDVDVWPGARLAATCTVNGRRYGVYRRAI